VALSLVGESRAVEPILAALQECLTKAQRTGDWDTDASALWNYAEVFWRLHDPRAVPVLEQMLLAGPRTTRNGKEYNVRRAAAIALRESGVSIQEDQKTGVYTIIDRLVPGRP
jgi:HEAT repeat protein